ncbi:hypothetical protein KKC62_01990 [Patescibacteria group bacterium]|nr:hypothetical protein [Patescibacteria group bacterium]MBU1952952.1 hypothetical protein [Patescibacteria group bacterium]
MSKILPNSWYITKKEFNTEIKDIKGTLSTLKVSTMNIEAKINIYSDMYEMNKWNLNKLANRVNKLEKQSGVIPPQELLISGL